MIEPAHDLPVSRQAELLELSRSNVYCLPRSVSEADLAVMRRIDELHLNFPFAGARRLRDMLKLEGFAVGRKHVRTLMDQMDIAAIYRKRNTSAPHPAHRVYESVAEAKQQLASYFEFYNTGRPHSSLGGQTPDTAYCGNGEWEKAA